MINLHSLLPGKGEGSRAFWTMVAILGVFLAINFIVVSHAAGSPNHSAIPRDFFLISLLSVILTILARHYLHLRFAIHLEKSIFRMRLSIIERVIRISLTGFEAIGQANIYQTMATGTRLLSEVTGILSKVLVQGVRAAAVLLALYWFSSAAFALVSGVVLTLCALLLIGYNKQLKPANSLADIHHGALFIAIDDLIHGFKEIKLNVARGDRFYQHALQRRLSALSEARRRQQQWAAVSYVSAEGVLLGLGGAMIFLLPWLEPEYAGIAVITAIVSICLPASLLRDIPQLLNAGRALQTLETIEQQLVERTGPPTPPDEQREIERFERLDIDQLLYHYHSPEGRRAFTLGPLSMTFEAGQVYFIAGGNGSGKSTLFKLITGLYSPQRGAIRVNGIPIQQLRSEKIMAPIFFDCHLFDRVYGQPLDDARQERANGLLDLMRIAHKTRMDAGRLSNLSLSSGQKKRAAMALALLEDKPVLLLDEWAADQDPEFRHFFYHELLPRLKDEGKTVIAITHDDRYFHLADQVYRLEYGKLA